MQAIQQQTVDLAVVGGAASAIHLLAELNCRIKQNRGNLPRTIAVVDPAVRPDGGSPHSDGSSAFRVNMRKELHDMAGYVPFQAFLDQFGGGGEDPPLRIDLGRYLAGAKLAATSALEAHGCGIRFPRATVRALVRAGSHYRLILDRGETLAARRIVIATGNTAPVIPLNVVMADDAFDRISAYDGGSRFARGIDGRDSVLILGTGPGGVDVARYLVDVLGVAGHIDLVSRTGMLSAVQSSIPPDPAIVAEVAGVATSLKAATDGGASLERLATLFLRIFRAHQPDFDFGEIRETPTSALADLDAQLAVAAEGRLRWKQVLEAIGQFAPDLWRALSPQARIDLLQSWGRLYYVKRHAMPVSTARWLAARLAAGRIRVGRLAAPVGVSAAGVRTVIDFLPGGRRNTRYGRLIVATGPEYRLSRSRNPLIRQMLDSGMARPYTLPSAVEGEVELGGFLTHDLELVGLPNVFAMGAAVRGEDFAVHSFPALARHAAIILDGIERESVDLTAAD